jgi:hypothetical protein
MEERETKEGMIKVYFSGFPLLLPPFSPSK